MSKPFDFTVQVFYEGHTNLLKYPSNIIFDAYWCVDHLIFEVLIGVEYPNCIVAKLSIVIQL